MSFIFLMFSVCPIIVGFYPVNFMSSLLPPSLIFGDDNSNQDIIRSKIH